MTNETSSNSTGSTGSYGYWWSLSFTHYSQYSVLIGLVMILSNGVLASVIFSTRKLRQRHGMVLIGGLALADMVYGVAITIHAYIHLRQIYAYGPYSVFGMVKPWDCFGFETIVMIIGSTASPFMQAVVSGDRLLAVGAPAVYMSLGASHGWKALGAVFGYCGLSAAATAALSYTTVGTNRTVLGLCMAMHSATESYEPYIPMVQMGGGVASVVLFVLALVFYRSHISASSVTFSESQKKAQDQLTRVVGRSVLVTLLFFVLPNSFLLTVTSLGWDPVLVSAISPYVYLLFGVNLFMNVVVFGIGHKDVREAVGLLTQLKSTNVVSLKMVESGKNTGMATGGH